LMGQRVATLFVYIPQAGPPCPRMLLRTELETKDYTSKLTDIRRKKDDWDLIRRRLMAQIGHRHGHARAKREALLRRYKNDDGDRTVSFDRWAHDYIHQWTRHLVEWCKTQGVGTIQIQSINTGDWPAAKFIQQLTYKAADLGIVVTEGADLTQGSGERAAKAAQGKNQNSTRKRHEAVRELVHQLERS